MNRDQEPGSDADRLIEDYLRRLRSAARRLPRKSREDLLAQVGAHIAEARAAGEAASEAAARNLLDRLGDPEQIAAAVAAETIGPQHSRLGGLEIAAVVLLLVGGVIFVVGWLVGVVLLWASPRWRWTDKLLGTLVWPGGLMGALTAAEVVSLFGRSEGGATICSSGTVAPNPAGMSFPSAHAAVLTSCTTTSAGSSGWPAWAWITLFTILILAPIATAIWLVTHARAPHPVAPYPQLG
jgi:hypothetical protein